MCVNNSNNQIIIFENINNKFIFYDFNFKLIKINCLKEELKYNLQRIVVNDKNSEIYSINSTQNKLIRFNSESKIVENLNKDNMVNLKYSQFHVYLLHFIVDTAIHFISIYSTTNQKKLKFEKKVYFDPLIVPGSFDFGITRELIIFHGYYINEWQIPNENKYMFLLNHEGDLTGKTILNLNIEDFNLTDATTFICKIKPEEEEIFDLFKVVFCDFNQLQAQSLKNIEINERILFIDEEPLQR
jgi:hypothetical protein